jgi:hypothetical protein
VTLQAWAPAGFPRETGAASSPGRETSHASSHRDWLLAALSVALIVLSAALSFW